MGLLSSFHYIPQWFLVNSDTVMNMYRFYSKARNYLHTWTLLCERVNVRLRDAQANSLCYKCKLIFGIYYKTRRSFKLWTSYHCSITFHDGFLVNSDTVQSSILSVNMFVLPYFNFPLPDHYFPQSIQLIIQHSHLFPE